MLQQEILPDKRRPKKFGQTIADLRIKEQQNRGSDAMFRTVYATHLSFSQMADQKAHLMLGINTLALSFVVTKKKFGFFTQQEGLFLPDVLLATVCLSCIILAILATRPAFPSMQPLPAGRRPNWLFFGDFSRYTPKEFNTGIEHLMSNPKAMSEAMSRDLYWLGVSLGRKYRYLSWCYKVFIVGSILLLGVFAWYGIYGA